MHENIESDIYAYGDRPEIMPKRRGQLSLLPESRTNPNFTRKSGLSSAKPPYTYPLPSGNELRDEYSREQILSIMEEASVDAGFYDTDIPTERLLFFIFR